MSQFNTSNNKRKRELIVTQDEAKCYYWREGDYWYLVDKKWSKFFIPGNKVESHLVEYIDNDDLLKDGRLVPNLRIGKDFKVVPEKVWRALLEKYNLKRMTEIKRKFILNQGRLMLELYPPVITVYLVDEMNELFPNSKPLLLEVSEMTSLQSVLLAIRNHFYIPNEREIRLWHSEESISKEWALVEYPYLINASMIDITDKNARIGRSGQVTWIVELTAGDISTIDETVYHARGRCGLVNMGNTCYMSSALQCLSNTPQLTRWFLTGKYKSEINRNNPLGMNGLIAEAYGDLIEQIWTTQQTSLRPVNFKFTISKFNATFSGFLQHDTQELLAFLLDGLHEDLNRITVQPYIELPDFIGLQEEEIAQCSWEYHLSRNDSIIVDLFQGQFRSTLVCKGCHNVSVTFDPFMYLSLPLPVRESKLLIILYVPYEPSQRIQRVTVKLNRESNVVDLQKRLANIVNTDPESLIVVEIYKHKIWRVFEQDDPISRIDSQGNTFAYEIPSLVPPLGAKVNQNGTLPANKKEKHNRPIVFPVYSVLVDESNEVRRLFGYPLLLAISREDASDILKLYGLMMKHIARNFLPIKNSKQSLSVSESVLSYKGTETIGEEKIRAIIHPSCLKIFYSSQISFIPKTPRSLPLNEKITCNLMTDLTSRLEVPKALPQTCVRRSRRASSRQYIKCIWSESSDSEGDDPDTTLKEETSKKSPLPIPLIHQKEGIVLGWVREDAEQLFGISQDSPWYDYDKVYDPDIQDSDTNDIRLSDCLDGFTREEDLSERDLWHCPKCKQQQHVTKKLDIWRLPTILVIHLKRFRHTPTSSNKIEDYVDFPMVELDMTDRVVSILDPDSVTPENRLVYDLYAVDNHYGIDVGGGHYIAFAQNCEDGKWYEFDDANVDHADMRYVQSEAAYLLFYKRRETPSN